MLPSGKTVHWQGNGILRLHCAESQLCILLMILIPEQFELILYAPNLRTLIISSIFTPFNQNCSGMTNVHHFLTWGFHKLCAVGTGAQEQIWKMGQRFRKGGESSSNGSLFQPCTMATWKHFQRLDTVCTVCSQQYMLPETDG